LISCPPLGFAKRVAKGSMRSRRERFFEKHKENTEEELFGEKSHGPTPS
jgi:hypothetical protein